MDEAELKYRKLHAGAITWSSAHKRVSQILEYWLMRLKYSRRKHINVRQLIILQNKLDIEYYIMSADQVTEMVIKSRNTRKS